MYMHTRTEIGGNSSEQVIPSLNGDQLALILTDVVFQNARIIEMNEMLVKRLTASTQLAPQAAVAHPPEC